MTFWQFINDHKTKITGVLLAVIGFLQTQTVQLQALMSPQAFAWFSVIAGAVVAGLGFLNSHNAAKGDGDVSQNLGI